MGASGKCKGQSKQATLLLARRKVSRQMLGVLWGSRVEISCPRLLGLESGEFATIA